MKAIERDVEAPYWVYECAEDEATRGFFITGGLGSAKTTGGTFWMVARGVRNGERRKGYPPTVSWDVAPTHGKVEDILVRSYDEVLPQFFGLYPDRDYRIVRGKRSMLKLFRAGHEIHFHSGDRPNLMVGTNITNFRVTEPGIQKRDVFEKCSDRLRDPRSKVRQFMLEGTPEGANWFMDLGNFRGVNRERNWKRYILETGDNTHLPAEYLPELRARYAYDPQKLLSYEKGLFVPFTKGSAYWEFFESRNVVSGVAPSPHTELMLCWDFNRSPLAWVVMQRLPHEDRRGNRFVRFVALAESSGQYRGGIMDACAEFMARFPAEKWGRTPVLLYGDSSGYVEHHNTPACDYDQIAKYLRTRFTDVRLCAQKHNPEIRQSLEKVNALLCYELYVVSCECTKLIHSHIKTSLKQNTWDIEKPQGEDWTHYGDATRYPLFQLMRDENIVAPDAIKIYGVNI